MALSAAAGGAEVAAGLWVWNWRGLRLGIEAEVSPDAVPGAGSILDREMAAEVWPGSLHTAPTLTGLDL